MSVEKQSKTQEGPPMTTIPKQKYLGHPFPLRWGLASLFLFLTFIVITQLQFNQAHLDAIYRARVDDYLLATQTYDAISKAHESCVRGIQHSVIDQQIFTSIADILQKAADLPIQLFPDNKEALDYQKELTNSIESEIREKITRDIPTRDESDCPDVPKERPVPPKR